MAAQTMLSSLRNNKKLLRPKRSFLNQPKRHFKTPRIEIATKKASIEKLEEIKNQARIENKRERKVFIISALIVFSPFLFLIGGILQEDRHVLQQFVENVFREKKERYLELVADGDQWLAQRKWHNAIFQYKRAEEIFPNEYDIHYRLAYAQCLRCEAEFLNCKEAKQELDQLLKESPKKQELLELKEILQYEYH